MPYFVAAVLVGALVLALRPKAVSLVQGAHYTLTIAPRDPNPNASIAALTALGFVVIAVGESADPATFPAQATWAGQTGQIKLPFALSLLGDSVGTLVEAV